MSSKLASAFEYYLGLGPCRTYQAVAEKFGASKRAVSKRATKENWQAKIAEIEAKARAGAEKRALESLTDMNERHVKSWKAVQGRAIEALRIPITSPMDGVRALDLAIRAERLIRGEPGERTVAEVKTEMKLDFESLTESQRMHLRAFLAGAENGTAAPPHAAVNGNTANGHEERPCSRDDLDSFNPN